MPIKIKRSEGFPIRIEEQFLRSMDKYLKLIDDEVKKALKGNIDTRIRYRDGIKEIMAKLFNFTRNFEKSPAQKFIEQTITNIYKSVNNFSRSFTLKSLKKGLSKQEGTEKLADVIELPPVDDTDLEGIIHKNVELIKTAGKEYMSKIETLIQQNITEARTQKDLTDLLEKKTKAERSQARFWASDQLGKVYSELNRKNQKSAGFNKYIWRTQRDQRVRDSHIVMEGTVQDYDQAPIVEGRPLHPGDDYNCRCYAEPVIDDTQGDESPADRIAALLQARKK